MGRRAQPVLSDAGRVQVYRRGTPGMLCGVQRRPDQHLPGRHRPIARVRNDLAHVVARRRDRNTPRDSGAPDVERSAADALGIPQAHRSGAVVRVAGGRWPARVARARRQLSTGLRSHSVARVGGLSIRSSRGSDRGGPHVRDRRMGHGPWGRPVRRGDGQRVLVAVAGLRERRDRDDPDDGRACGGAARRRGAAPNGSRHPGEAGRRTDRGTGAAQRSAPGRDRRAYADGGGPANRRDKISCAAGIRSRRHGDREPGGGHRLRQRSGGNALRVLAGGVAWPARGDADPRALPAQAPRAPPRILHRPAGAVDGRRDGPVRAAQGRDRVSGRDQPRSARDGRGHLRLECRARHHRA